MKRHIAFIELVFGWRDCDSGNGAARPISAELRSFFEGWMGEVAPTPLSMQNLSSYHELEKEASKAQLSAFANRLEDLAALIRQEVEEKTTQP